MHGLINRSIQGFVWNTYGAEAWGKVAAKAALEVPTFEAMLIYDDVLTDRVLDSAASVLDRPRDEMMEDIGTYLVSHSGFEAVRRLLRFGGVDFEDFLHSLDDLPDRAIFELQESVVVEELHQEAQRECSNHLGSCRPHRRAHGHQMFVDEHRGVPSAIKEFPKRLLRVRAFEHFGRLFVETHDLARHAPELRANDIPALSE